MAIPRYGNLSFDGGPQIGTNATGTSETSFRLSGCSAHGVNAVLEPRVRLEGDHDEVALRLLQDVQRDLDVRGPRRER